MKRTTHRLLLISSLLVCGVLFGNPAASIAADEYLFDSELSLTGDCDASAVDPVPDPPPADCPSGDHPAVPFNKPRGFASDQHGNMYVSNAGKPGRIDIFNSEGLFISELLVAEGSWNIAVDSEGYLYVRSLPSDSPVVYRFMPTVYNPAAGEIEYGNPPIEALDSGLEEEGKPTFFLPYPTGGMAINPTNDHLLVHYEKQVVEFSSAKEGNERVDSFGLGTFRIGKWVAVDAARNRVYTSDYQAETNDIRILVFELEAPHALVETIPGADVPGGKFAGGELPLAANEDSGDFFAADAVLNRVLQFNEDYEYIATITHNFISPEPPAIAVDNGPFSPNPGYLFVTSGTTAVNSHSYAFAPPEESGPPEVESIGVGEVSENEAELLARINPEGAATHYTFEYTTAENFESGATVAGEGDISAGTDGVDISAAATGLAPGTKYRFRVVAENEPGTDEEESTFTTYPAAPVFGPCANDAFRTGASALLPDCRAHELVTPPDTNGRSPSGAGGTGVFFPTLQASAAGSSASFSIFEGTLPGHEGAGAFNGQNYGASRSEAGWQTEVIGPNGTESISPLPGGISPDQEFAFWATGKGEEGTAVINNEETDYVRYPDGHSELIGRGSLGTDSQVDGKLISEGGGHIIFRTRSFGTHEAVQLEEIAPPNGIATIYDHTADEVTHVVSLLPGDETPAQGALYLGASYDGEGVAFSIGSTLYLRVDNEETFEIDEGATFAGVSEGGRRVFYLKEDDLFAFDAEEEETIPFTNSGDVTVVNISEGGSGAYFVSPTVLVSEPNPQGDLPEAGEQNLYLSEEGAISFVGIVTDRDVEGVPTSAGDYGGLGLWTLALERGTPARDPSRTTPDGDTLLFESRADLTGFASDEFAQVYRYNASEDRLDCLSCNPTGAKPTTDATLQSVSVLEPDSPLGGVTRLPNVRPDGARAFFQSSEPLVAADTDGLQDVYEWEEQGIGSCTAPGGCTYLISSGKSADDDDYLFAVSASGNDAFFITSDQLHASDPETTRSVYDARVGGGFPEASETICSGEGCRPALLLAPVLPNLGSKGAGPFSNPPRKCPKGKRKVKRHGKVVCIKKKKHRKHKQRNQKSNRPGASQ